MTTDEMLALIAESKALPTELTRERLDWIDAHPAPWLTLRCPVCRATRTLNLSWGEVEREIELRGSLAAEMDAVCEACAGDDEE